MREGDFHVVHLIHEHIKNEVHAPLVTLGVFASHWATQMRRYEKDKGDEHTLPVTIAKDSVIMCMK